VGGVGAWKYFATADAERARLPWFAQPWFWVPALLLVALAVTKDALGPAVPTVLKKPFDIAEAVENKLSGLIAAGLFVPVLAALLGESLVQGGGGGGLAAISAGDVLGWLLTPFAWAAFIVVWLLGNTINVLILVSPFATVDAGLKLARAGLLATVAGTSFVNPYLGAAWALAVILAATLVAGWTFRLTVFGGVFLWDFLTLRRHRTDVAAGDIAAFLAREMEAVPARTFGRLRRDDAGRLVFRHRPWLVLPARELALPAAPCCVGVGLLHPDLRRVDGGEPRCLALLPPRYAGHEAALTRQLALEPARDVGLRAAWRGLREMLGCPPATVTA
jgi:hypothetical protein